jgi:hypothetical protein
MATRRIKKVSGNLTITDENIDRYLDLEHIGGDLAVGGQGGFVFPRLAEVGGHFVDCGGNEFPMLHKICGDFEYAAKSSLPFLLSVGGGVQINFKDACLPRLKEIHGSLWIEGFNADLPGLVTVGGSVAIRADRAKLPKLGRVYKFLEVSVPDVSLPELAYVAGALMVGDITGGVHCPRLKRIDGELFVSAPELHLPFLDSIGGELKIENWMPSAKNFPLLTTVNKGPWILGGKVTPSADMSTLFGMSLAF